MTMSLRMSVTAAGAVQFVFEVPIPGVNRVVGSGTIAGHSSTGVIKAPLYVGSYNRNILQYDYNSLAASTNEYYGVSLSYIIE